MLDDRSEIPGNLPPPTSRIFNNKFRLLLVGLVTALALGYLVYAAFPGNTLYYLTVDELLDDEESMDGRSVRVVGKLVPDSFNRETGTVRANFALTDQGEFLEATYDGVFPDLFFNPHSDVVLEGRYGVDDVFHTDTVIVKCPSKYQALSEEG